MITTAVKKVLFIFILFIISANIFSQKGPRPIFFHNCGFDESHHEFCKHSKDSIKVDMLERNFRRYSAEKKQDRKKQGRPTVGILTIPVVVHIIHNNGQENISDAQVFEEIQNLNEAYANIGYYDRGTGVDVQIQFCLAKRDPEGNTTNGITRNVSSLTYLDKSINDQKLKDIIQWNPYDYANIWVVEEIVSGTNTSVAGYAYYPSAHGRSFDGMVCEARFFGTTKSGTGVTIHEMGHYLGLRHTFQGGCINNDCTTDGDQVCDTPPDNSTGYVACGDSYNSCSSDEDDLSTNNPFRPTALGGLGDQPDMHINYMDYGDFNCYSAFTEGQKERMRFFLETTRASLCESEACIPPCEDIVTAEFTVIDPLVNVGEMVDFTNTSLGGTQYQWNIDGVPFSSIINSSYTFSEEGTYLIELVTNNADPNCERKITKAIKVVCPTRADFTPSNVLVNAGDQITFTNTSINANAYEWVVNNTTVSTSTSLNYTFNEVGDYSIDLIAENTATECVNMKTQKIEVICPVVASFLTSNIDIAPGESVTFTNNSTDAINYEWYVNSVLKSTSVDYVFTPHSTGIFEVELIASNGFCEKSYSILINPTLNGIPQTGLPVWPIAVLGDAPLQTVDWQSLPPVSNQVSGTMVNGGQTGAAFNDCGELLFYAFHSGTNGETLLNIFTPDGQELLSDNTPNGPGLRAVKGSQEIQVVKVPSLSDEWYIIYKEWTTNTGAQLGNGAYTAANWLYSRVRYDGEGLLEVLIRDKVLVDEANVERTYSGGAAVSRTVNGDSSRHYLYLRRMTTNSNNTSLDRFIISDLDIVYDANTGNVPYTWYRLGVIGSPIELSPTEDRIAVVLRNQDSNKEDFVIFDANAFSNASIVSISAGDLMLQPDGGPNDESNVLPVQGQVSDIATNNLYPLNFLRNMERKIGASIEFSPNGRFLYFVNGGFSSGGNDNLTYLGQIDLNSSDLNLRLQIQTTSGDIYNSFTGVGCAYSTSGCLTGRHPLLGIQSSFDGKLYFSKINSSELFVVPNPDGFLPQNLVPSEVDLSTVDVPNVSVFSGSPIYTPDQIDGFNYLNSNHLRVNVTLEGLACDSSCYTNFPYEVNVRDELGTIVKSYNVDACPYEFTLCLDIDKNYDIVIPEVSEVITNAIQNGLVNYADNESSFRFKMDESCIEICDNNIDDDGDGLVDLYDPDCPCNSTLELGPDKEICEEGAVFNIDAGQGFISYLWQDGLNQQIYTAWEEGIYSIEVTNECGDTLVDTIQIIELSEQFLSLEDTVYCDPDTVKINVSEYVDFQVDLVDIAFVRNDSLHLFPSNDTVFTVTAINENGCLDIDSIKVEVVSCVGDPNLTSHPVLEDVDLCITQLAHTVVGNVINPLKEKSSIIDINGAKINDTSSVTIPLGTPEGIYQSVYVIENLTTNEILTDTAIFNVYDLPSVANAGLDITTCDGTGILAAVIPVSGSGFWDCEGVNLSDPLNIKTEFTGLGEGVSSFCVWTVANGVCPLSRDTVFIDNPRKSLSAEIYLDGNLVSDSVDLCIDGDYELSGNKLELNETGAWSTLSGSSVINISGSQMSFPSLNLMNSGTTEVQWKVSSILNDCDQDSRTLLMNVVNSPAPKILISGDTLVCKGDVFDIIAVDEVENENTNYEWYLGSDQLNTNGLLLDNVTKSGVYTLIAYNNTCAEVISTEEVNVSYLDSVYVFIDSNEEGVIIVDEGNEVVLTTKSNGDLFWWGSNNANVDNLISISNESTVLFDSKGLSGLHQVFVKTEKDKCAASDTVLIQISSLIKAPNVFTPDGDGINDVFSISGLDFFPDAKITIYNRWGSLVYLNQNIYSDFPWDGGNFPEGVYYFILEVKKGGENYTGVIHLIR